MKEIGSLLERKRLVSAISILLLAAMLFFAVTGFLGQTAVVAAHDDPQPDTPIADVCFVETTGDNITDYSSADASAVQTAVNDVPDATVLKIAGICEGVQEWGLTMQTVYISKPVSLKGGYSPTNWLAEPDSDSYPTTLDAAGDGRVILIKGMADTEISLENLNLTEGYAELGDGGGLHISESRVVISNTTISDNLSDGVGGGLIIDEGILTLTNSQIIRNEAQDGGGVANENATITISNTIIFVNLSKSLV